VNGVRVAKRVYEVKDQEAAQTLLQKMEGNNARENPRGIAIAIAPIFPKMSPVMRKRKSTVNSLSQTQCAGTAE